MSRHIGYAILPIVCGLGFLSVPARSGDFGVWFRYSSGTPQYCVSWCAPRSYAYDYVYYQSWQVVEPTVYVYPSPGAVVYEPYYPASYGVTYTRSYQYVRPVRHTAVVVRRADCDRCRTTYRRVIYRSSSGHRRDDCRERRLVRRPHCERRVGYYFGKREVRRSDGERCRRRTELRRTSSTHRRHYISRRPDCQRRTVRIYRRR